MAMLDVIQGLLLSDSSFPRHKWPAQVAPVEEAGRGRTVPLTPNPSSNCSSHGIVIQQTCASLRRIAVPYGSIYH